MDDNKKITNEDTREVYDEFFEHAMHLLNDHQAPVELIAGTMLAIAQRLYRTQLSDEEYEAMMEMIKDAPVNPYEVRKERIH
jgi:tRNA C32,U32 (ribose-2'-O)-methylase TrmJ